MDSLSEKLESESTARLFSGCGADVGAEDAGSLGFSSAEEDSESESSVNRLTG